MSNYYNVLTNLGRAKITELITSQNEFKNIQIAFGDGNGSVPTPNPVRTSLVNEVHRRPADKLERHPTLTNNIIVDVVIPASVGSFWIREFGIYFDGVLICHGSLPPSYKEASEDSVNTYRLKPYINVESDRINVVEVEGNLVNATESWTEENFIKRSEIIDNLTTNDATKPVSAKQAKVLQDNKLDKTDLKAASETIKGVIQIATHEEVLSASNNTKAITPLALKNSYQNQLEEIGYSIRQDGYIEQWGVINFENDPGEVSVNVTFPISFPSGCLNFMTTRKMNGHWSSGDGAAHFISATNSSAIVSLQRMTTDSAALRGFTWRAIGK